MFVTSILFNVPMMFSIVKRVPYRFSFASRIRQTALLAVFAHVSEMTVNRNKRWIDNPSQNLYTIHNKGSSLHRSSCVYLVVSTIFESGSVMK